jgi:hypothetical protein
MALMIIQKHMISRNQVSLVGFIQDQSSPLVVCDAHTRQIEVMNKRAVECFGSQTEPVIEIIDLNQKDSLVMLESNDFSQTRLSLESFVAQRKDCGDIKTDLVCRERKVGTFISTVQNLQFQNKSCKVFQFHDISKV